MGRKKKKKLHRSDCSFKFAGTKGRKGKPGVKGSPGYFVMKFFNLRNRKMKPTLTILPRENSSSKNRLIDKFGRQLEYDLS